MRATTPTAAGTRRLRGWRTTCGALALALLVTVPARAQVRSASVRVNVTVLDFATSDVIGVHGIAPSDQTPAGHHAGVRGDGASWRITTGGSSAVGVRLESVGTRGTEPSASLSLCGTADGPGTCRPEHLPAALVASGSSIAGLLLRLGGSGAGDREDVDRSVRLTIDYLGS